MQQKKQMRILHRMWLLHSDILLCHVFWAVNKHSSSSSSSSSVSVLCLPTDIHSLFVNKPSSSSSSSSSSFSKG